MNSKYSYAYFGLVEGHNTKLSPKGQRTITSFSCITIPSLYLLVYRTCFIDICETTVRSLVIWSTFFSVFQTFRGSLTAVSTPIFASKASFFSVFRALHFLLCTIPKFCDFSIPLHRFLLKKPAKPKKSRPNYRLDLRVLWYPSLLNDSLSRPSIFVMRRETRPARHSCRGVPLGTSNRSIFQISK